MADPPAAPRFVVDAMLGRLARWLRVLGYDTLYPRGLDDRGLLQMAAREERLLLTRDVRLARLAGGRGCLIRAPDLDGQLAETLARLGLDPPEAQRLTRCLECNTPLVECDRAGLPPEVPPRIRERADAFWRCPGCRRTYWAGSHVEAMVARLERLLARAPAEAEAPVAGARGPGPGLAPRPPWPR
jgi:uncharacterized protein with PIN domain